MSRAVAFFEKWVKMKESGEPFEPAEKSLIFYGVKKDWPLQKIKDELAKAKEDLKSVQESPYKTGFIKAMSMVLFPVDYSEVIGDTWKREKTD
jgi:hypothetical protein